ncbi:HAD family hydrolase [Crossiella sp. SN42]|uniref:HAD family hydrolase n=1 Tax=unclassified Crossiella TaxID=2620835 RepID=UPI00207D710A|nr:MULTISPECIES: HAD family hydrolase [unclassified Crossiella]MCO1580864.1 HAD family hydrolase [Crossiella sp. SN42]WHT18135.1 HAD family hydrolase [Crossiella sp. CA-258035]
MTSALAFEPASQKVGQIRAVCFDIDDTLVDYATSARLGLAALLGHDNGWAAWERATECQLARLIAGEIDYDTMRKERSRTFFADLGEFISDTEAIAREERRVAAMRRAWRLFDDAGPCLEWLRGAGLRMAAITNASGALQRVKLADCGLAEYFEEVVIAGELGVAKPDEVIFHTTCAALGIAPEQAVHVGDRLDLDAVGARDAGMYGVWLDRSGAGVAELPERVSVIGGLEELPELLVCELAEVPVEVR